MKKEKFVKLSKKRLKNSFKYAVQGIRKCVKNRAKSKNTFYSYVISCYFWLITKNKFY